MSRFNNHHHSHQHSPGRQPGYSGAHAGNKDVPPHCQGKLRSRVTNQTYPALCYDVRITGMQVCTPYVPQQGERIELTVYPPDIGGRPSEPFTTEVEAVCCLEVQQGQLYQLTVNIVTSSVRRR